MHAAAVLAVKDDIARVRRDNLRALISEHGGPSALGKKLGHAGPSFLSQMVTGKRPITEKTVRSIEEKLGLARWSLDQPPGGKRPFADTDRALIAAVVRAVGAELERVGLDVSSEKFAQLVAEVYGESAGSGEVDTDYLSRLIQLLK